MLRSTKKTVFLRPGLEVHKYLKKAMIQSWKPHHAFTLSLTESTSPSTFNVTVEAVEDIHVERRRDFKDSPYTFTSSLVLLSS
jgi:hypothetical protein